MATENFLARWTDFSDRADAIRLMAPLLGDVLTDSNAPVADVVGHPLLATSVIVYLPSIVYAVLSSPAHAQIPEVLITSRRADPALLSALPREGETIVIAHTDGSRTASPVLVFSCDAQETELASELVRPNTISPSGRVGGHGCLLARGNPRSRPLLRGLLLDRSGGNPVFPGAV